MIRNHSGSSLILRQEFWQNKWPLCHVLVSCALRSTPQLSLHFSKHKNQQTREMGVAWRNDPPPLRCVGGHGADPPSRHEIILLHFPISVMWSFLCTIFSPSIRNIIKLLRLFPHSLIQKFSDTRSLSKAMSRVSSKFHSSFPSSSCLFPSM